MKPTSLAALLLSGMVWQAPAQTFDTSGDGLLKGAFNFREVTYQVGDSLGNLSDEVAVYGVISFDGQGKYTINGTRRDPSISSTPQSFSVNNGTYQVAASGLAVLSSPIVANVSIFGLVSNGIFIGSSTESGFNDLFVAAPQTANAKFSGSYWVAGMDFPSSDPTTAYDALFQLNPDGKGSLGTVHATGYIGNGGNTSVTQSIPGATYSFSNGVGALNFGAATAQTLITGSQILYVSPDGNFIFGGSASGWDLFVGVRTNSASINFNGLYYQAGLYDDESNLASNGAVLNSYYGSFSTNSNVNLGHQRLASQRNSSAFDYTYDDPFKLNNDGISYDDAFLSEHYVIGAGGTIRIGLSVGPLLGVSVAIAAPSFSGPGVLLYPTGILNAASSAPFTSGVSPGELITLYGTGLAPKIVVASSLPFPAQLDGVQVMINGRAAPIYYVSPTQISAIVPYATELSVADIQVINNGVTSNTAMAFVNQTMAGVFTIPVGGLGYAAALHKNYSLVKPSSPAQPGETIQVFLTGLGSVNPPIADGAAGPPSPFSLVTNQLAAYVEGTQANITYQGLAPGLGGLYQLNIQIPTGLTAGDTYLDISGPDSYTSEAKISIGSGATAAPSAEPATPQWSPRTRRILRRLDARP
jgi:uncharacterized protein (TIGR03437 family)